MRNTKRAGGVSATVSLNRELSSPALLEMLQDWGREMRVSTIRKRGVTRRSHLLNLSIPINAISRRQATTNS